MKKKVDLNLQYIPMKTSDVEAIDYLLKISKGRETVSTDKDWMIVAKLFEFWTRRWPEEWQEFGETIEAIKGTRLNKYGTSKSNEIKYVGALPYRFERMLKGLFPMQQFDKKFIYALTKRIKIVKVGERKDSWFLI